MAAKTKKRKSGYYRVRLNGKWYIAWYRSDDQHPAGDGWFYLPRINLKYYAIDFDRVDSERINVTPNKQKHEQR